MSDSLELSENFKLSELSEYSDGAGAKFRIVRRFRKRVRRNFQNIQKISPEKFSEYFENEAGRIVRIF